MMEKVVFKRELQIRWVSVIADLMICRRSSTAQTIPSKEL